MSHAHKLDQFPIFAPDSLTKSDAKDAINDLEDKLRDLQNRMYANKKRSLLIVLQGMDASGKDGSIKALMKGFNPVGVKIASFKKPTEEELSYDFLWRVHKQVPPKGIVGIFNRSHYEDVLIQRVRKWIDIDQVHRRYEAINSFERLLEQENNCTVLKFYLHLNQDEQYERLQERKEIERKFWKHNPSDWAERERWDEYMVAYEDVFKYCGPDIPWHIAGTGQNWYKEHTILSKVAEVMASWKEEYPPLEEE
jgi:PPK2 family polyphosphate:nucleotide phosphotransferase